MEGKISPADVLRQRKQILDGISQVCRLCGWSDDDIQGLNDQLWESMVRIDNTAFECVRKTGNEYEAREVWLQGMGDLQYWLSLVLRMDITLVF